MISKEHNGNNDVDGQPADEAGGEERLLGEKLPDRFRVGIGSCAWYVTGGIEIHRLVTEDYDQLERRSIEINKENINSTCSIDEIGYKEVGQTPLSLLPR